MNSYRNGLVKGDLLRAVVAINTKYAEAYDEFAPAHRPEDPIIGLIFKRAYDETLELIRDNGLDKLVVDGKIARDLAAKYLSAVQMCLCDLRDSGDHDAYAEYFRQVFPESEHPAYRDKYRYVFEKVVKLAVDEFRKRLK
jgi:hypothetical protein